MRAQILLDQAGFSPGVVDGSWGGNTGKAAFWFQDAQGLPTTGIVDAATFARLRQLTSNRAALVRYTVTAADVAGPFQRIPDTPYAQAELPCLCYRSAMELLAERHHTTPAALAQLNPGVDTARVAAGAQLWVPNVRRPIVAQRADTGSLARRFAEPSTAPGGAVASAPPARAPQRAGRTDTARGEVADSAAPSDSAARVAARADSSRAFGTPQVARIVVSLKGNYLHALDAQGRILLHAPTTLGSQLDSTPAGALRVTRVAYQPDFHYNPKLYAEVPDTKPDAHLPPGPNSPVGVMWMALDKPRYGIHGTNAPETVGYAQSHGCVRLTNWDVRWLADRTPTGVTVEFR
jgi:lipoprotein-anchoring transpeptidase ErfK/SrfK